MYLKRIGLIASAFPFRKLDAHRHGAGRYRDAARSS